MHFGFPVVPLEYKMASSCSKSKLEIFTPLKSIVNRSVHLNILTFLEMFLLIKFLQQKDLQILKQKYLIKIDTINVTKTLKQISEIIQRQN